MNHHNNWISKIFKFEFNFKNYQRQHLFPLLMKFNSNYGIILRLIAFCIFPQFSCCFCYILNKFRTETSKQMFLEIEIIESSLNVFKNSNLNWNVVQFEFIHDTAQSRFCLIFDRIVVRSICGKSHSWVY